MVVVAASAAVVVVVVAVVAAARITCTNTTSTVGGIRIYVKVHRPQDFDGVCRSTAGVYKTDSPL